jgi:hypothetical protein
LPQTGLCFLFKQGEQEEQEHTYCASVFLFKQASVFLFKQGEQASSDWSSVIYIEIKNLFPLFPLFEKNFPCLKKFSLVWKKFVCLQ